ncbi:DUF1624 domain-containing protein [Myxococcaceae bacterium JPH2]|nr:DUF1624 domain-containing protein [Myxococcaceae bacterium JPH2]
MPGKRGRLEAVDAARGTVMMFVFLAHFADAYLYPLGGAAEHLRERLYLLTMMASPGFMLISGLMLGLLYARRRGRFAPLRRQLQRRALFLLTVGHLVIVPTYRLWAEHAWWAVRVMPVTDTIGLALLLGPFVISRLSARSRAVLGLSLFAGSWALSLGWWPEAMPLRLLKEVLFGQRELSVLLTCFPVVPWFGVYLGGTVFGEWLGTSPRTEEVAGRFQRVGLLAGTLGVLLVGLHMVMKRVGGGLLDKDVFAALYSLTSHSQKYPPGPAYVALYGGASLSTLGLLMRAEQTGILTRYLRWAAVVGRHSLMAFMLQYYVYYVGIHALRLPYFRLWPLLFVGTVAVLWAVLWTWDAREAGARQPEPLPTTGGRA